MRTFVSVVVALGCGLLFAGCQGSTGTPSKAGGSDRPAKASILGRWTTSTSPEMASSRTTMAFLESGEYQYNSPLMVFGKPATVKVEGKEVAARLIASGTWELDGDRLRVRITQTNQPSVKFDEPLEYKVISSTDKKLVLEGQGEGGEVVALFREE
jgi:hypothetical protein